MKSTILFFFVLSSLSFGGTVSPGGGTLAGGNTIGSGGSATNVTLTGFVSGSGSPVATALTPAGSNTVAAIALANGVTTPAGTVTNAILLSMSYYSLTNTYFVTNCPTNSFNGLYTQAYVTNGVPALTNGNGKWLMVYNINNDGISPCFQISGAYDTSLSQALFGCLDDVIPSANWEVTASTVGLPGMICYGFAPTIVTTQIVTKELTSVNSTITNLYVPTGSNSMFSAFGDYGDPDIRLQGNIGQLKTGNPNGVGNAMNLVAQYKGTTATGIEFKVFTNGAATSGFIMYYTMMHDDWAARLGTYSHVVPLNDWVQSAYGPVEKTIGYNGADSAVWHNVGGGFINAYGLPYPSTNSSPMWIQPSFMASNATAGSLGDDGTNLLVANTNKNGAVVISPVMTRDSLTNGNESFSGTFSGNGGGLTNVNWSLTNNNTFTGTNNFTSTTFGFGSGQPKFLLVANDQILRVRRSDDSGGDQMAIGNYNQHGAAFTTIGGLYWSSSSTDAGIGLKGSYNASITELSVGTIGISANLSVTGTATATGFISTATNTSYSFTGTGFTNGAGDLILKGVTGVNVTFTNRTSGYGVSYGTITTPTDMFLTQSNVVNAASAFNIIGFQTH